MQQSDSDLYKSNHSKRPKRIKKIFILQDSTEQNGPLTNHLVFLFLPFGTKSWVLLDAKMKEEQVNIRNVLLGSIQ